MREPSPANAAKCDMFVNKLVRQVLTYLRTSTHSRHISAISRLYLGYISHSRDRATREDSALAISLASSRLYLGYISAISRPYLELQRSRDAGRLGVGGFISEFGACGGSSTCLAELARVMDAADGAAEIQPRYSRDTAEMSSHV